MHNPHAPTLEQELPVRDREMDERCQPLYSAPVREYRKRLATLRTQLLASNLPDDGLPDTNDHLQAIAAAIPRAREPTFFGFVTGGATPAAQRADALVSQLDANVMVDLRDTSIATAVEDTALRWLLQMLRLDPAAWPHRICSTGATASNVLGLACGRDYVVREAAARRPGGGADGVSVARLGLAEALRRVGARGIRVLTSMPHSSLRKAASIVGLGHAAVVDVTDPLAPPLLDVERLRRELMEKEFLSIVSVSAGEINTGFFATTAKSLRDISRLCHEHGAWLHVDGAFGLNARLLIPKDFHLVSDGVQGIELADSITGDAHKLLNVPYDCGIFFSRHLDIAVGVFENPGAAYLTSTGGVDADTIASPSNVGIENSRRFRALPLYASLRHYGKNWYREMVERQIATARRIARWIRSSRDYVLLPDHLNQGHIEAALEKIFIIVLFRAKDPRLNGNLVSLINSTGDIYVSGTVWEETKATRIAVANWKVDPKVECSAVVRVLSTIAQTK